MIPYICITWKECKNIFLCKFDRYQYLRAFTWYIIFISISIPVFLTIIYIQDEINEGCTLKITEFSSCNIIYYCFVLIFLLKYYFANALFINVPEKITDKDVMNEEFKNKIAIIITTHNSEDVIENTFEKILLNFPPEVIYVADNNKDKEPTQEMVDICKKYNVNFHYIPKPNKANALREVVKLIDPKYEYVFALDDDTLFPDKFVLDEKYFIEDDKVAGVTFMLMMKNKDYFIERLIELEFVLLNYNNYLKNYSSLEFMIGSAGLWKKDIFERVLEINPAADYIPYGEDGLNGVIARLNGYKFKQDIRNVFYSFCPNNLYFSCSEIFSGKNISGYNSTNLWKQRALRWYRSGTLRLLLEIYTLFIFDSSNKKDNICTRILSNLQYRLLIIWTLFLHYIAIVLPYIIILAFENISIYLYTLGLIYISLLIAGCITKYKFRHRDDIDMSYKLIIMYPIYMKYALLMKLSGIIGTILYFAPFHSKFKLCGCMQLSKIESQESKEDIELVIR